MREPAPPSLKRALTVIVVGGVVVGVLYVGLHVVINRMQGVGVTRVLQAYASIVMGPEAFRGGRLTALGGLVVQGVIGLTLAAGFVLLARHVGWVLRHPVWSGVAYGVLAYFVIHWVVIPLSASPFTTSFTLFNLGVGMVIYIACVGMPLAWLAARYLPTTGTP